jgi:hypothetical protein
MSRCAVLRRCVELAAEERGEILDAGLADRDIVAAAKSLGIPI